MLPNTDFHQEVEKAWQFLGEKDGTLDSSCEFTEIESGLTSKFYDIGKSNLPAKKRFSFVCTEEKRNKRFGFQNQPKPWLPPTVLEKIDLLRKSLIDRGEMTSLLKEVARISIDFYKLDSEHFVALRFDGRVVEDADSEIELLLKIQGRDYGMPVFVWHVGHESFLGWTP